MILFPPAKINLGLSVLNKRIDGFHNLETVFFQLPFCDILEITKSETFNFKSSGIEIKGNENDNLCIKAYNLLKTDFDLSPVKIHLHKIIPMGAGLGGGSADGTYTLLILNELFSLDLSVEKLKQYALNLGSDCPLFVSKSPQKASSRGEILEDIFINLSGKYIHIINVGIHISTKEAFENLELGLNSSLNLDETIQKDLKLWKENLINDFEKPIFVKYHELKELKEEIYANGAKYASMTGTGSTIFGIYDENPQLIFEIGKKNILEKVVYLE